VRTEARFPALDRAAGHYESFYLKAAAPEGGRALWIRHTVHKRPGQEPTAAVWFTWFEEGSAPRAAKASFRAEGLSTPDGSYVRVDGSQIGPGRVSGSIAAGEIDARWELEFADRHEPLMHLSSSWMYRGRLPRTKLLSPHPGAIFRGRLELDGETIELSGWPGMVGHNWGTEHAERWIWLHGADFEGGEPGDYLDIAAGRIKLGRWTTPWVPNGMLVLAGEPHRLGGLGRTYGTEIDAEPGSCRFVVTGKDVTVRGTVQAPRQSFVGWVYADPGGGEHNAINCSIADMELRVERPDRRHAHLTLKGAAAFELGMRETDHGIPIQPFGDG
jgi:hypothetical protein